MDKGPRALGLVQLSPKGGKGRIIPIAIMMDGKFYDAGSYKASPVPMALEYATVYEAFVSGVSQGLFTVTQPGQLNHTWIAEGSWLPAGLRPPEKSKKYATPVIEDPDGPPVLHRRESGKGDVDTSSKSSAGKDKDSNQDKDQPKDQTGKDQKPASPPSAPPSNGASIPPGTPKPSATDAPKPATTASAPVPADEPMQDPNRPRLRRGKPDPSEQHEPFTTFDALPALTASAPATSPAKPNPAGTAAPAPQITLIPAISDAAGPDPRPYIYDVKPAEEAIYRNKMLDLAATQISAQARAAAKGAAVTNAKSPSKTAIKTNHKSGKTPKPDFNDVRLRIFDLSNSNEPVLVLSAKTQPPAAPTGHLESPQEITLIARTNLEGEVQKLFFSETDSDHLDVTPRMELIDAVDADGDGRGELLFRRTTADGSAYAIYRVTADGLWPLFEGTP